MNRTLGLAFVLTLLVGVQASAQTSISFDFEDNTDQGFGNGFGDDASEAFPIVNIGGSLKMEVLRNGGFQEAGRQSQGADAFLSVMNLALAAPAAYNISYDWYVDTSLSPGNYGNFLQLGTYLNSGTPPDNYVQDFPAVKDVELNGTQLASGQVFSGTVTETVTAKYGVLPAGFVAPQGFMRLGLIVNGDGTAATVYFDNVSISPVPEPAALALVGLGIPVLGAMARKRRK